MTQRHAPPVGALLAGVIAITTLGCSDLDRIKLKARLGGTDSQIALANRYASGRGVEKSEEEAVRWYRKAAESGHTAAQVVLGNRYLQGIGVEQDAAQARDWFRRSAEAGDPSGQYHLGFVLIQGIGGERQPRKGTSWIQKAAERGHPEARQLMESAAVDPAARAKQLREQADKGDAQAQFDLAQAYLAGHGVDRDRTEAVHWLERAGAQDHSVALFKLGYLVASQEEDADPKRAAELYRRAADQGFAPAQHHLGEAYLTGKGVDEDPAEAVRWIRKSADQGLPASQRVMAQLYRDGLGVEPDLTESVRWLKLAAEAGDLPAQYNLGYSYAEGIGIGQDVDQAFRWYSTAAERGHALAQVKLALAYLLGDGAEADPVRSYAWFEMARRGGAPIPADGVERLNSLLSEDQRAEATVLVEKLSAAQGSASVGS